MIDEQADVAYWRARAERAEAENATLAARVDELSQQVAVLSRMLFGDSSEKKKKASGRAAGRVGDEAGGNPAGAQRGRKGQRPGSKGHGRRDYSHLEMREEIHDVPEQQEARVDHLGQSEVRGYSPYGLLVFA